MSSSHQALLRSGEKTVFSHNAIDKRKAWRNSGTVGVSEKDSLLTNSGEDRISNSLELRIDDKAVKDNGVFSPCANQGKELGNRLRVPSPTKKSGFYSTSPSTDEGIGAEDQGADPAKIKPTNHPNSPRSKEEFDHECLQTETAVLSNEDKNNYDLFFVPSRQPMQNNYFEVKTI